jgi:uncharacterized protein
MQPIVKITLIALLCLSTGTYASAQSKDDVIIAQAPGSFSLHGHVYHKSLQDGVPPATGYVTDWEDIYSDAQEAHLDSLIAAFEAKTSIQIAIVTLDSAMTTKDSFDSTTLKIANSWGVGQKEKNNGLVIGISGALGIMRIQNGNGITALMSDADTQKIVDTQFLPSFEQGEFYKGTLAGLQAIIQKLQPQQ